MKHQRWSELAESRDLLIPRGIGLLLALVATGIFIDLAGDVWLREGFTWDVPVMLAIHRLSRPWLDQLMLLITSTGNEAAVVVLGIVVYVFWRRGDKLDALTVLASFVGAVCIDAALKLLFARPRPHVFPPFVSLNTYSFPSGHALTAVALYGLLAILLWRRRHRWWALVSGLWVFLVGFSRVYLGVHYPSDVLGSLTLGTLWLFIVVAGHDGFARRQSEHAKAAG